MFPTFTHFYKELFHRRKEEERKNKKNAIQKYNKPLSIKRIKRVFYERVITRQLKGSIHLLREVLK